MVHCRHRELFKHSIIISYLWLRQQQGNSRSMEEEKDLNQHHHFNEHLSLLV